MAQFKLLEVTLKVIQLSNTKTLYALYPVWILNTKWKDKSYRFAVNGQTGKVAGDLPVSALKFMMFWSIFFLGITGIVFAIGAMMEYLVEGLIAGMIMGAIISTVILLAMRRKNKNVKFQYGASPYVREGSFHVLLRKDIFLYRKIYKTARSSSSRR